MDGSRRGAVRALVSEQAGVDRCPARFYSLSSFYSDLLA